MAKEFSLAQAGDLEVLLESLKGNSERIRQAVADKVAEVKKEVDDQGALLVAALERHTQGSERLLRDEEVAVLKDGLCPGDKAEKDMKGHSWESRIEDLELRARMCFFPSVGKVRVGHLLLGSRSIQSNEADSEKMSSLNKRQVTVMAHLAGTPTTFPPPSIREDPGSVQVTTPVEMEKCDAVKDLKSLEAIRSTVATEVAGDETMIEGNSGNPFSIKKVEAALDDSIPEGALLKTGKTPEPKRFNPKAGSDCVARWSEDQVWYRAQVAEVRPSGDFLVVFTDYGNSDLVEEGGILAGVEEVAAGEQLDVHLETEAEVALDQDEYDGVNTSTSEREFVKDAFEKSVEMEQAEETDKIVDAKIVKELPLEEKSEQNDEVSVHGLLSEQLPELKVGDFCIARFSEDDVWYNGQVLEVIEEGKFRLLYTDYGNEEVLEASSGRIVTSLKSLRGDLLDDGVHLQWSSSQPTTEEVKDVQVHHCEPTLDQIEAKSLNTNIGNIPEGGNCLAVWDEDGVLYRATLLSWLPDSLKAEVLFTDYGNKDTVCKEKLFSDYSFVPEELRHSDLVDINIVTSPVEFDATKPSSQEGLPPAVRHVWSVKAPPGPHHLVILDSGRVVVAVASKDKLMVFSPMGESLTDLRPIRKFGGLRGVAKVGHERLAVLDDNGIQLFSGPSLVCEKHLELTGLGKTGGTCSVDRGDLVIVNRGTEGVGGKITSDGEVDLLYVSLETGKLRKRLEMVDILGEGSDLSCCNHAAYQVGGGFYNSVYIFIQDNRLHVVDSGLCQLYTLYEEGGEPQAMLCGSKKEWEKPSGVAVDVDGTLLVADSPTSRLVKISKDLLFTGEVVEDPRCPFFNPEALALNHQTRELVVHNHGAQEIVKFKLIL